MKEGTGAPSSFCKLTPRPHHWLEITSRSDQQKSPCRHSRANQSPKLQWVWTGGCIRGISCWTAITWKAMHGFDLLEHLAPAKADQTSKPVPRKLEGSFSGFKFCVIPRSLILHLSSSASHLFLLFLVFFFFLLIFFPSHYFVLPLSLFIFVVFIFALLPSSSFLLLPRAGLPYFFILQATHISWG